jgi:hypothetical protein
MNPGGAIEEGAKVAAGIVDGLKSQPLSLALIVLNLAFISLTAWLAYTINERTTRQYEVKDQLIERLIEQCRDGKKTGLLPQ